MGDESRLECTVIGDAVNLAATLEKHTKIAQVDTLTSKERFDLACKQGYQPRFDVVHVPQTTVAGVAPPIDLVGCTRSVIPIQATAPAP